MYLFIAALYVARYHYRPLDFVHLGTVWAAHNPHGTLGYDGQFYYQIARAPRTAAPYLDNAPYRYERILYPLVARLMAMGRPSLVPVALLAVNWVAIVASVELLARLLRRRGLSPWYSLGYGLYFGLAAGFAFDTAEPFAYALVCAAIGLWQISRFRACCVALGLAALARETTALFTVGFVVVLLAQQQWRRAAFTAAAGCLPLFAWLVVLRLAFGQSGPAFAPPFERVPFAGVVAQLPGVRKFALLLLLVLVPTVGAMLLALTEAARGRRDPLLIALALNCLLMIFLSRAGYADLIAAGRIGTGVPLALVCYGIAAARPLAVKAALYYVPALGIYLAGVGLGLRALLL